MRNLVALLGSTLLVAACNFSADAQNHDSGENKGSGSRTFQVGAFDRVALGGSHNVIVTVGGAPSVRAEGDLAVIDRLDIHVENGELSIGTKEGFSLGWKSQHKPVTIFVTAPSLAGASIGGSGDMKIDRVSGERFAAAIGGSGDMQIQRVEVRDARFSVAGSGNIQAIGKAETGEVSIAGSGDVSLDAFEVQRAKVSVVGSGDVRARVMQSADVSIAGSGDVELSGTAKCNVSKMGSGDVRCVG
ncbi:DUF2807 domain-containing protein [Sphingomonas parva]|uniref:DUF2807 domain-containing protein n=1 Tax=Sphingomonas parva TaxID=2555898 RepID=A0A4Y8ZUD0_9SPHN|nr:head GIN domain-containing protein [Sphingomonas parva]TFI58755.1 DUF2807 domain-containing protein [Sphingomonas parva]